MSELIRSTSKAILAVALAVNLVIPTILMAAPYTIDHYEFGKIIISGVTYEEDVVILPNGTVMPGPEDMHYVRVHEIEKILAIPGIETLIVGTGAEGSGLLTRKCIKIVKARGINLQMMLTKDAMEMLNRTPKSGLVAMLHLNC